MMTSCPEGLFSYTIQSGDTLWMISRRHYTTVEAIMAANPGINPGNLQVGQMICIPAGNRTTQTQPTQPAMQPTQPATQPAQPTQPAMQPTQPTQPTQPGMQPTQPMMQPTQPTQPRMQPTQPGMQPTQPMTQPTQPRMQPAQPMMQPTQPAMQPTQPRMQPTMQPAQPTMQPMQPARPQMQPNQPNQPQMQPMQPTQPQTPPTDTTQMSTTKLKSEAVSDSKKRCPVGLRAYTIQKGDTLWLLAKKYCTNVEAIMALNPGIKPGNLMIGQVIWIPAGFKFRNLPPWAQSMDPPLQNSPINLQPICPQGTRSYTIEAGDTLWLLSQRFNTTVEAIMAANPGVNPTNLFVGQVICIPRNRPQPQPQPQQPPQPMPPTYMWVSKAEQNLDNYLRFLWLQQVYWQRMAIQSELWNLSDAEDVRNRLMENPVDFQMALKTFYGEENAKKFADLLTNYLTSITDYAMASRDGNTQGASDAENRMNSSAGQMVAFLASINPNWSAVDLQKMFNDYMNLTKDQIASTMSQNFEESINTFADTEIGALEVADMMAQGIVKQFPQYFR